MVEYAIIKTTRGDMMIRAGSCIQDKTLRQLGEIVTKEYPGAKFMSIKQISQKAAERLQAKK